MGASSSHLSRGAGRYMAECLLLLLGGEVVYVIGAPLSPFSLLSLQEGGIASLLARVVVIQS